MLSEFIEAGDLTKDKENCNLAEEEVGSIKVIARVRPLVSQASSKCPLGTYDECDLTKRCVFVENSTESSPTGSALKSIPGK